MERAQGRMEPADYERLKATDEHRLLHILDRLRKFSKMGREGNGSHSLRKAAPATKKAGSRPLHQGP